MSQLPAKMAAREGATFRLLNEAWLTAEAAKRFDAELKNANNVADAVMSFMDAVDRLDKDRERGSVLVHDWPDSKDEELVDRCINAAMMDVRMATIAILEYHAKRHNAARANQ